ncbi:zinc/iron regulated transporter-related protein 102B [Brevipalpus obovatus]|uniref:zinc/iron regulated transporter-related protein 102B n=1 Tax=Brevipalpus obovatus TaxID=246614 RepID=UPI003D9DF643
MMDQFSVLALLALSMLFGSYFAGTMPIIFNMSERKIRFMTILGSGILVGTALSVIIPEGVNTLYASAHEFQRHLKSATPSSRTEAESPHSVIGLALLVGFIFMLLVDEIAARKLNSAPVTYSALSNAENADTTSSSHHHHHHKSSSKITATIGLVVHAAADGIALGAAATTSHTDVEMVVFLAIMLHKAPAAFGLITFLMHEGLERKKLRKHLLVFSLSAPVASLITYFSINNFAQETLSDYNATGVAMLFSAGTFLYVATVHVLPEITQNQSLKLTELLTLVGGSLLPSILTLHHHH